MSDTILTFPEDWYRVASGSFHLASRNFVSVSPWTGRRGASGPLSQLWTVKITLSTQERQLWCAVESFFAELGGQSGRVWLPDFAKWKPQRDMEASGEIGPWSDSTFFDDGSGFIASELPASIVTAEGAERGANQVTVSGLPESSSRVLRRGDNVEFRRDGIADGTPSLHMLIRDCDTDADGETLLQFRPALRKGLAAGDMVVLQNAKGIFRLIDDQQAEVNRTLPLLGDLGFELIEAIV